MDRANLEQLLEQGLSLAEIGRQAGLHEATVGYWVKKHGLLAANHGKYLPRGALEANELAILVSEGLSSRQIADQLGRSQTTVRHWLKEYGLVTEWAKRRVASSAKETRITARCQHHGLAEFVRRSAGGYRCTKCRAQAVSRRRRRVKEVLVDDAGGRCVRCGYDRCIAALEFHHLKPSEKRFSLSHRGVARSLEKARAEAAKCVLVCANCHAEIEAGIASLARMDISDVQ